MYNSKNEELEISKYWDEHKCFEKSVESRPADKEYSFYDGPPFATGLPHYGHIVASLMKDIVPRYFTMRGYRVERRWGWDCHGLPVENIVEQELNLKSKKDIENYGMDKFCSACRSSVLTYVNEWKKTVKRMGRWVDMEADYKTMDLSFMESVWWVFNELWKQNLIYKGYKPMHICPRCETPLSNFEVTQGYKDVDDISVTVKFSLSDADKIGLAGDIYILAWTTTPWTLPGNVLLAVNEEIDYLLVQIIGESGLYLVAEDRAEDVLKNRPFETVKKVKGKNLVGLHYQPLFPYFKETPGAFRVIHGNFVTVTDGTGVVHIAPAFGEDDFNVGQSEGLPLVQHVKMNGRFVPAVTEFADMEVKPKEDTLATDKKIISWLKENGKLFSQEIYYHSYPHCWRCDTPLLNFATASWFVRVTELKDELLNNNKQINWVPEHIKEGRFGLWLEGARDWAISRNRFWGTPLPIWENEDGEPLCVGSVEELEKLSGEKISDIHKNILDKIVINKDGKEYHRIPEVLDCWFESGSMPYAQMHYPFENKEKFERNFPAEFIAEGQDQTRGWFYTLHVLSTALTSGKKPSIPTDGSKAAFKNCIVNGIVLAEDGKKMAKRLKNYPEPGLVMDKFGADALRYYLASSPVMEAENLNFSENSVREVYNKLINTLWNVFEFYKMYEKKGINLDFAESKNILDRWILAKLQILIKDVTEGMDKYRLIAASRPISEFVGELSQWYVRRSRDRFKSQSEAEYSQAVQTLQKVLFTLSKIMAPFTPFIAEKMYLQLGGQMESVHLEFWPEINDGYLDDTVLNDMVLARKIVENGLALRAEKAIRVRQPLSQLVVNQTIPDDLANIVADELNVKEIVSSESVPAGDGWTVKEDGNLKIGLNTVVDEQLRKEGLFRELVRTVNQMRKEAKLTVSDKVRIIYNTEDEDLKTVFQEFFEKLKESVAASSIEPGDMGEASSHQIDGREINIKIVV